MKPSTKRSTRPVPASATSRLLDPSSLTRVRGGDGGGGKGDTSGNSESRNIEFEKLT